MKQRLNIAAARADLPIYASWNDYLMSVYPWKVQKWLLQRGGLTDKWLVLMGEELRATVRICDHR